METMLKGTKLEKLSEITDSLSTVKLELDIELVVIGLGFTYRMNDPVSIDEESGA